MLKFLLKKKLSYGVWYNITDGVRIMILDESNLKIEYGDNIVYIDVVSIIEADLILSEMMKKMNSLDLEETEENYEEIIKKIDESIDLDNESLLKKKSIKELNQILNTLVKNEDYAGCSKIKKIIDEKRKKN